MSANPPQNSTAFKTTVEGRRNYLRHLDILKVGKKLDLSTDYGLTDKILNAKCISHHWKMPHPGLGSFRGMKHIAALQLFYHGRLTVKDIKNKLLKQMPSADPKSLAEDVTEVQTHLSRSVCNYTVALGTDISIWMLQRPKWLHVDINDNPPPFNTPEERKEYYASILDEYPILEPSFLHKATPGLDLPYIYTTANRMEPEIRQLRNDMKAIARARILSYLDLIFLAGLDRDGTLESLKSPTNVAWIREQLKIAFDKTHLHMFVVQLEQWPLSTNAEKKNLDSPWKRFSDGIVGGVEVKRNMFGRL